ncbi:MAG: ABC transporter substrate-binding protein, partial [Caldilineaceae bacterium]|nr:ABC transporter substrate-binding protein [Caldilineaceae bacterium]
MAVYRSYPDHAPAALPRGNRTLLRNAVSGLLLLLLSSLLAACGSVMPAATTELDSVKLQLNWVHSSDFAGFYVADAKGFYADENLSVEFLERDNDVPSRQKLVNGEADFALLSLNRINDL